MYSVRLAFPGNQSILHRSKKEDRLGMDPQPNDRGKAYSEGEWVGRRGKAWAPSTGAGRGGQGAVGARVTAAQQRADYFCTQSLRDVCDVKGPPIDRP